MKTAIQQMLAEAYELEGLLLLADNRGDDTPEYVHTAIGEKIDRLRSLAVLAAPSKTDDNDDEIIGVTGLGLFEAAQTAEPESFDGNDADAVTAEDKLSHELDDTEPLSLMIDTELEAENPQPESETEEFPAEPETETETEEPEVEELATEEADDIGEVPIVDAVIAEAEPAEEVAEEEDIPEGEDDIANEEEEFEEEPYEEPETDEPVRLDEMLQRSRSKDLKSAFSLNDTFRFRRELFSNSGAEMTDALHLVEAMQSFDEAEDYFYGDLGWDRESDDVKDFMAIIKNHFL